MTVIMAVNRRMSYIYERLEFILNTNYIRRVVEVKQLL